MFKQLKIKLNIIYILSIALILGTSLLFIYTSTVDSTYSEINKRLEINGKNNADGMPIDAPPNGEFTNVEEDNRFSDEIVVDNNDKTIEQLVEENIGEGYAIDTENQIVSNDDEYYAYNMLETETKFIAITKDINFLQAFRVNLIKIFALIMILASVFGYFFIKTIIKPVAENYELQKEFVADASHELKTPLAVLKSCLNLIAKGDDESQELIKYSQMEVDRLTNLTSNLLKLSENGKASDEVTDLSFQTDLILSGIEVQLFENQMKFNHNIAENIKVNISSEEYSQLIHILIDNATKYNDSRKKIDLKLQASKNNAYLTVSNTADPISEEDLSKLFERFYREDKSRNEKTKGFGLGLSIASHIVNKYHGTISCDYQNSRFIMKVKLPLK